MDLLTHPTRHLLFTGKGGVGKTSLACATAIHLAEGGRRLLLVSTDPASILSDVLGVAVATTPVAIPGVANLRVVNIDPQAAAAAYRERVVGPYRDLLPTTAIAAMEEQLGGACTVEIAAFDQFTALLAGEVHGGEYDVICFDTAPTGHTLRLLALPAAWSDFLATTPGGASCLGPATALASSQARYRAAMAALADPLQTTVVLVARPEATTLAEAARTAVELAGVGMVHQRLIVNGRFTATDPSDPVAAALERRTLQALAHLPAPLAGLARDELPLQPYNLVGVAALRHLFTEAAAPAAPPALGGTVAPATAPATAAGGATLATLPGLGALIDDLAAAGHGLLLFMGKGGVGKTTLAAAVAWALATRGHAVHLSTTDPAAHLHHALAEPAANLTVGRIDPAAESSRYTAEVLAHAGANLDAEGRRLLAEDLRSPCTEEVAVFHAFARHVAEAQDHFVVLDTAPTGHTLLLLDATGAYHREVARRQAASHDPLATPLMRLRDPAFTRLLIVTLAEPTPVFEATALQDDLRRAGITPYAWIINASLAAANPRDPLLVARAAAEVGLIHQVQATLARRCYLVPWRPEPPDGAALLAALGRG